MDAVTLRHFQTPAPSTPSSCVGGSPLSGNIKARFRANCIDFSGLANFLRREHPIKTADGVEGQTGIPAKTVRKWLDGETSPNGAAVLTLALAYGPQIIAACVKGAPGWLDAATRHDMARKLNASIDRDRAALDDLMKS